MQTNRRLWLKYAGLGMAGIGLTGFRSYVSPVEDYVSKNTGVAGQPVILRSNENPYGPSPLARKAFADNASMSNRYHWSIASQLVAEIAAKSHIAEENILLGAGSTEILDLSAKLAAVSKGNYVIADPTYDYWTVTLDHLGMQKIKVPLADDKRVDLQAMLSAINGDTKLVYICNPNNPTGTTCERDALVECISATPRNTIILIDEAYLDFTKQQSLCSLVNDFPNMVVAKTFSKIYGLAGARIGYAIAGKAMIGKLANLQSNTNNSVSVLSKLAAIASLKDDRFVSDCRSLNESARKYTITALEKSGCTCIPSDTNFIYFSLSAYKKDYFGQLENNRIQGTRIYEDQGKWTRITVGTMEEMKMFIKAIQ
ncbi:MAG TPA: histidinol-phosphate transaminase [Sediminibacterium sp.]